MSFYHVLSADTLWKKTMNWNQERVDWKRISKVIKDQDLIAMMKSAVVDVQEALAQAAVVVVVVVSAAVAEAVVVVVIAGDVILVEAGVQAVIVQDVIEVEAEAGIVEDEEEEAIAVIAEAGAVIADVDRCNGSYIKIMLVNYIGSC